MTLDGARVVEHGLTDQSALEQMTIVRVSRDEGYQPLDHLVSVLAQLAHHVR
ncbi:hypothetical protein P3T23_009222 [Paraburkholderia sp. GAS448]